MKGTTLPTPPSTGLSGVHFSNTRNLLDEPERPESIDNCTKNEVRIKVSENAFYV